MPTKDSSCVYKQNMVDHLLSRKAMEAIAHCHGSPLVYILLTVCRRDLSITQLAGGPIILFFYLFILLFPFNGKSVGAQ